MERSTALPSPAEAGRAGVPAWRGLPHCPQNLKVGGFSNPQWEQRLAKGAAQLPQNFMPSGFSNPHFEQDCTLQIYLDFRPPPIAVKCVAREVLWKALKITVTEGQAGTLRKHSVFY
jgi:hypothetical protein